MPQRLPAIAFSNTELVPLASDPVKLCRRLEEDLDELNRKLVAIYTHLAANSVVMEARASTGQSIRIGHWLHIRDSGKTAYLATAVSTLANPYYATSICIDTTSDGRVYYVDGGTLKAFCKAPGYQGKKLWLSTTAGWATDSPPVSDSNSYLQQEIGFMRGLRGDNGLCLITMAVQGFTSL